MKNRDKPAMPIVNSDGFCTRLHVDLINHKEEAIGLTKREHFAGLAMQGLLSNSHLSEMHGIANEDVIAESLSKAGALLEALEKDNSKVMSDAVDREQELIRLKDEASELRIELALERAKAVSRNEFIASLLKGES
jgi:hypothetical protein